LLLAFTWIAPATYAPAQAERIAAACREGIDWDVFLSLVDRHRVLVPYDALRRVLGVQFPARVYEQLKTQKAEACKLALLHTAELVRLNKAFRAQGIEMLPMKGMMLSLQLFGDPAMRSTRDLDLLVRPEKLDDADRILKDEGYRRTYPDFALTPKRQEWVLQQRCHFAYYRDDRRQLIELHWRLLQWRAEHVAELWNHCEPTSWIGTSFLNLKDDALLLFLCDHGAKHRWSRIKWLSDVAGLLAQERSFSWENILALADRFDLSLALAQAGMLVHWLYGVPLPQPLLVLVANEKRSVSLAAQAIDAMLLSEKEQFALPVRFKNAVHPIRIRERLPGHVSLRYCWLSTDEFKECPLPDSLFWLYFPLRPLLWFYHHYIKRAAPSQGAPRLDKPERCSETDNSRKNPRTVW
jgi:Uncharacterised nucleotidyltransferase